MPGHLRLWPIITEITVTRDSSLTFWKSEWQLGAYCRQQVVFLEIFSRSQSSAFTYNLSIAHFDTQAHIRCHQLHFQLFILSLPYILILRAFVIASGQQVLQKLLFFFFLKKALFKTHGCS